MNHISITTLEAPELDIYARLSEGQLFHYNEPKEGLFIAESPKVIGRALDAGYEPVSFLMEERHIETEGPDSCKDVEELTEKVLHEARVFITPGFIFGSNGARYIRISLCCKDNKLAEALERIKRIKNK